MNPVASATKPDVSKLFIGPWVGEFGVELLRWQSIARTLANERTWNEVVVSTHPDRFFLYEDFATKFIPVYPQTIHTVGHRCQGHRFDEFYRRHGELLRDSFWLSPNIEPPAERVYYPISACRSTYRNFAEEAPAPKLPFQLLIHARATTKANQNFKNWPYQHFEALVEAMPTTMNVASIGSKDGAHKIRGTYDLRGIPLRDLAGYCKVARMMIGPSSGAIHFAMHCGTPVLTWINLHERHNYFPQWNPQNVPFCCLSNWQPEPAIVLHKFHELLKLIETRQQPVDYIIVGIKGSGHEALFEWLSERQPEMQYVHWKDCIRFDSTPYPPEDFVLPSEEYIPRDLHRNSDRVSIIVRNIRGKRSMRVLSLDGADLHQITNLPEAHEAKRVIFALRDAKSTIAALKFNAPEFKDKHLLHPEFSNVMNRYRTYLREATTKTDSLSQLKRRPLFISLNRWEDEPNYRRDIATELRVPSSSKEMPGSRQSPKSGSHHLNSDHATPSEPSHLWSSLADSQAFWNLACDANLFEMESAFHGVKYSQFVNLHSHTFDSLRDTI